MTSRKSVMFLVVGLLVCGLGMGGCKKKQAEPEKPAAPKAPGVDKPVNDVEKAVDEAVETTQEAAEAGEAAAEKAVAAGVINSKCPIMGNPIDPADVPGELTRQWKGVKVGFCCPACLGAWDKLSDDEKLAKLTAAAPGKELPKL